MSGGPTIHKEPPPHRHCRWPLRCFLLRRTMRCFKPYQSAFDGGKRTCNAYFPFTNPVAAMLYVEKFRRSSCWWPRACSLWASLSSTTVLSTSWSTGAAESCVNSTVILACLSPDLSLYISLPTILSLALGYGHPQVRRSNALTAWRQFYTLSAKVKLDIEDRALQCVMRIESVVL